ncbi:hypothetical protein, partial [Neisseria gonorrhoeae]|uniref:hypothetical protein n=1 Tax=Neisseria gonorrhoeae TaxID=485 RepID=UPI0027D46615
LYSGLTKIRTRRRAAGSTDGTEPIRPVLQHLREPFPLSRGGATRTGFCSSAIKGGLQGRLHPANLTESVNFRNSIKYRQTDAVIPAQAGI